MYEFADNKKAVDSQKKIYKALRRILLKKPLSEVSVADITKECGISRSTFYRNFQNVSDVLAVIFEWYYNNYHEVRRDKQNQLLFFYEYWYWHRDLIQILSSQNPGIIKDCMKRHEKILEENPYFLEIKYALLTSILCAWSQSKEQTPQELEKSTRPALSKKSLDFMLA